MDDVRHPDRKRIEYDLIQEQAVPLVGAEFTNGILILVDDLVRYANPVAESLFKGMSSMLEGRGSNRCSPRSTASASCTVRQRPGRDEM